MGELSAKDAAKWERQRNRFRSTLSPSSLLPRQMGLALDVNICLSLSALSVLATVLNPSWEAFSQSLICESTNTPKFKTDLVI